MNKGLKTSKSIAQIFDNISKLTKGRRTICDEFGTVRCTHAAAETKSGERKFSVSGSTVLTNRGNWTMSSLRKAILSNV